MRRTLQVCLGDASAVIDTLRYDAHGARESTAFEYHPSWLRSTGFAIDPQLALVAGAQ